MTTFHSWPRAKRARELNETPAIEVSGLRKTFDTTVALDGLDLTVPARTVTALIGPNGSGKTTTIQILATLLMPDEGHASVFGRDVIREAEWVRTQIGVTGQFSAVDPLLTGRENLALMGRLHHLDRANTRGRADALLEQFELVDSANRPVATYSGGMRRRLDLAMTLVGEPRIIFLDEPTTGLDPRSRRVLWTIVRDLVSSGVTVLLTTQYLDEADEFADSVVLIERGRAVACGTPNELKQQTPGGRITLQFVDARDAERGASVLSVGRVGDDGTSLVISSDGSVASLRRVLDAIERLALRVEGVAVQPADLDDVFFALTGSPSSDAQFAAEEIER